MLSTPCSGWLVGKRAAGRGASHAAEGARGDETQWNLLRVWTSGILDGGKSGRLEFWKSGSLDIQMCWFAFAWGLDIPHPLPFLSSPLNVHVFPAELRGRAAAHDSCEMRSTRASLTCLWLKSCWVKQLCLR